MLSTLSATARQLLRSLPLSQVSYHSLYRLHRRPFAQHMVLHHLHLSVPTSRRAESKLTTLLPSQCQSRNTTMALQTATAHACDGCDIAQSHLLPGISAFEICRLHYVRFNKETVAGSDTTPIIVARIQARKGLWYGTLDQQQQVSQ
jgi:hypothetical protein